MKTATKKASKSTKKGGASAPPKKASGKKIEKFKLKPGETKTIRVLPDRVQEVKRKEGWSQKKEEKKAPVHKPKKEYVDAETEVRIGEISLPFDIGVAVWGEASHIPGALHALKDLIAMTTPTALDSRTSLCLTHEQILIVRAGLNMVGAFGSRLKGMEALAEVASALHSTLSAIVDVTRAVVGPEVIGRLSSDRPNLENDNASST